MAERTSHAPGTPAWVDLGSPDIDASTSFYGELLGWTFEPAGPPELTGGYGMFLLSGKRVAGAGPKMDPNTPTAWTTYVYVTDLDATVEAAKAAGASVILEPMDVLDAGRMAILADPEGAVVAVWQPVTHLGAQLVNVPGTLCWNELATRDPERARAFYSATFGWKAEDVEGNPTYWTWRNDDRTVGGMLLMGPQFPAEVPASWTVYFAVDDLDASLAKLIELGGKVEAGKMEMPGMEFAVVSDPQGAVFALIRMDQADD